MLALLLLLLTLLLLLLALLLLLLALLLLLLALHLLLLALHLLLVLSLHLLLLALHLLLVLPLHLLLLALLLILHGLLGGVHRLLRLLALLHHLLLHLLALPLHLLLGVLEGVGCLLHILRGLVHQGVGVDPAVPRVLLAVGVPLAVLVRLVLGVRVLLAVPLALGVRVPLAVFLLLLRVRVLLAVPVALGVGVSLGLLLFGVLVALAVPVALGVRVAVGLPLFGVLVALAVPVALGVGVALGLPLLGVLVALAVPVGVGLEGVERLLRLVLGPLGVLRGLVERVLAVGVVEGVEAGLERGDLLLELAGLVEDVLLELLEAVGGGGVLRHVLGHVAERVLGLLAGAGLLVAELLLEVGELLLELGEPLHLVGGLRGLLALLGEGVALLLELGEAALELLLELGLLLLPGGTLLGRHRVLLRGLLGEGHLAVGHLGHLLGLLHLLVGLLELLVELGDAGLGLGEAADELVDGRDALLGGRRGGLVGGLEGGPELRLEQLLHLGREGVERAGEGVADELLGGLDALADLLLGLRDAVERGLVALGDGLGLRVARLLESGGDALADVVDGLRGGVLGRVEPLVAERAAVAVEPDGEDGRVRDVRAAERGGVVVGDGDAEADVERVADRNAAERGVALAGPDAFERGGLDGERARVLPAPAADAVLQLRRGGEAEVLLDRVLQRDATVGGKLERAVRGRVERERRRGVLHDLERERGGAVREAVVVPHANAPRSAAALLHLERPLEVALEVRLGGAAGAVGQQQRAVERAQRRRAERDARPGDGGDLARVRRERAGRRRGVGGELERRRRVREVRRLDRQHVVVARHGAAADDAVAERARDRADVVAVAADALLVGRELHHALGALAPGAVGLPGPDVGLAGEPAEDRELDRERRAAQDHGRAGQDAEVLCVDVVDLRRRRDGAQEEARDVAPPEREEHEQHPERAGGEEEARADGPRRELALHRELARVLHRSLGDDLHQQVGALGERVGRGHELDDRREALLELRVVALDEAGEERGRELARERPDERLPRDDRDGGDAAEPEPPAHPGVEDRDHRVDGHDAEDGDEDGREDGEDAADHDDAADAGAGRAERARDGLRERAERDVRDARARELRADGLLLAEELHGGCGLAAAPVRRRAWPQSIPHSRARGKPGWTSAGAVR